MSVQDANTRRDLKGGEPPRLPPPDLFVVQGYRRVVLWIPEEYASDDERDYYFWCLQGMFKGFVRADLEPLNLKCFGMTAEEIGGVLGRSDRAVAGWLTKIYGKLRAPNEAAACAVSGRLNLPNIWPEVFKRLPESEKRKLFK